MEAANYGILSLIPLALTLLLAFWKKDAVFALFMGCLSGVLLLGHDPAFGFSALAEEALGNEDFIWILLIQVFIGIMIAFFMKAGVVKAFAEMIAGKVKSPPQRKAGHLVHRPVHHRRLHEPPAARRGHASLDG